MNIAPSGHSAQQEKKVANNLYRDIIIMVIVTAIALITYGFLSKDINKRVENPTTAAPVPAESNP